VRSEVQIFPGPPAFTCSAGYGSASREAKAAAPKRLQRRAIVSRIGAIAQLGERVLCKHDVVGSIPSGSTNFVGADDSATRSRSPAQDVRDLRKEFSFH
jgi:hypothetical protein